VGWLARWLAVLFQPAVAAVLVALAVVAFSLTARAPRDTTTSEVALGYAWFLAGLVMHELGHASAVAYFGGRPGGIGFTFYVIYPALYSDVTSAWALRRRQRVVVDIGGVYFQIVFAAGVSTLGLPGADIALAMTAFSLLMTLQPFLKFDGYWLLSDALGVANLAKERARMLVSLWLRFTGRTAEPFPWSVAVTATLGLYAVASSVFTLIFAIYLLPALWNAILAYPGLLHAAVAEFAEHGYPQSTGPWLALASATLVVYFGIRIIVHAARRVISSVR
jgi:putative peptide zinc metalloprotease protein